MLLGIVIAVELAVAVVLLAFLVRFIVLEVRIITGLVETCSKIRFGIRNLRIDVRKQGKKEG